MVCGSRRVRAPNIVPYTLCMNNYMAALYIFTTSYQLELEFGGYVPIVDDVVKLIC